MDFKPSNKEEMKAYIAGFDCAINVVKKILLSKEINVDNVILKLEEKVKNNNE